MPQADKLTIRRQASSPLLRTPAALVCVAAAWAATCTLTAQSTAPSAGKENRRPKAKLVILFIIDGLAEKALTRFPMPALQSLAKEGCAYKAMHLPLPGHPKNDPRYPWSCSMPNPMLMAGTPFIGAKGIRKSMIQHQFKPQETVFIVNAYSYKDVSGGFGTYISKPHKPDSVVIEETKRVLAKSNPAFIRVHLQRSGIDGEKCSKEKYADKPWHRNIWHQESLYRTACIRADKHLGEFVAWHKKQGHWQDTIMLICGDHGQADEGWHEPYSAPSSVTPLIVAGAGVASGRKLDYCEIFDIAPTVAHLAGRPIPPKATGRVLLEAFDADVAPPKTSRTVARFNELLRTANARRPAEVAALKKQGFLTLDDISQWHLTKAGTDFSAFVSHQQKLLGEQVLGQSRKDVK